MQHERRRRRSVSCSRVRSIPSFVTYLLGCVLLGKCWAKVHVVVRNALHSGIGEGSLNGVLRIEACIEQVRG